MDEKSKKRISLIIFSVFIIVFILPAFFSKTYKVYIQNNTSSIINVHLNPGTHIRGMKDRLYQINPGDKQYIEPSGSGDIFIEKKDDKYKVFYRSRGLFRSINYNEGLILGEESVEIENRRMKWIVYKNEELILN